MEKVELEAKQREKTGTSQSRRSRLSGMIPAIVYGRGIKPLSIEVVNKQFSKIISSKAGRNVIITLKVTADDKSQNIPVLTHSIVRDSLKDSIVHVDFYKISMEEEIKTKVPVILHG